MKKWFSMILMMFLIAACGIGLGETMYVDNQETDKTSPERLNLRAEPSKNGAILGLYYTGAQVEVLGTEEAYTKVKIGAVEGYMASEYLITAEQAEARYGKESGFGDCRAAKVELGGMWASADKLRAQMFAEPDPNEERIAALEDNEDVQLIGIHGDEWAYIAVEAEGEKAYGYVPLSVLVDVAVHDAMIVAGSKADTKTILYDAPNDRAKEIMVLKNGTPCFSLFGRKEGNWVKVRVGGEPGWIRYTQADNLKPILSSQKRNTVPYYPLLMQTKGDALLYSVPGEKGSAHMTLGAGMNVEILAEAGEYVYVRTLEGGAGVYHLGDYGYMALTDLALAQHEGGMGVAQADDGDLPVLLYEKPEEDAAVVGALIAGAQVRITDYTQTDFMELLLGEKRVYAKKQQLRALGDGSETPSERIPQRAAALEDVTLLSGPGGKAAEVSVQQGERVYMLAVCGEWAYVQADEALGFRAGDAEMGFVKLEKLNAPQSTIKLMAFVTKDKINMRNKPSREGEIVGRARLEERLRVADYGKEWCCVVTPEGKRGYVMTEYLTFE